jgi:hypothetical protein
MTSFYTRMKAGRATAAEATTHRITQQLAATKRSSFYRRVFLARHPRVLFV